MDERRNQTAADAGGAGGARGCSASRRHWRGANRPDPRHRSRQPTESRRLVNDDVAAGDGAGGDVRDWRDQPSTGRSARPRAGWRARRSRNRQRFRTDAPRRSSSSTRWEPMETGPPVTRYFGTRAPPGRRDEPVFGNPGVHAECVLVITFFKHVAGRPESRRVIQKA
jgi:hypothetical protein